MSRFLGKFPDTQTASLSSLLSALSYALDLTEGQPAGHSNRACLIGLRIGEEIGLPQDQLADLYFALLLKDAGCSSNSSKLFQIIGTDDLQAKGDRKAQDWTRTSWESLKYALDHVGVGKPFLARIQHLLAVASTHQRDARTLSALRCELGASIARKSGFSDAVAQAIQGLDEHWDGRGYPAGLEGTSIPLFARILHLAQTLEVFFFQRSPAEAIDMLAARSGRWFDPELCRAALALDTRGELFAGLRIENLSDHVAALAPGATSACFKLTPERLDNVCEAFAEVIDAKSPFTYRHSNGVANAALAIGKHMSLDQEELNLLRRAALLHDIGKLSVPNSILEKPGKLSSDEWNVIRRHPYYTLEILNRIPGFSTLSDIASAHHEKLDGTGYFRGWSAAQLSLNARILAIADVFDALHSKRPYRDAIPAERVFDVMRKDAPHALDGDCLQALIETTNKHATFSQELGRLALAVSPQPTSTTITQ